MSSLLSPEQMEEALARLPRWRLAGDSLVREVVLEDFTAAFAFLTRVALLAQGMDHHPDMALSWAKVELTLSTHSAGGVTDLDLRLADAIEDLLSE